MAVRYLAGCDGGRPRAPRADKSNLARRLTGVVRSGMVPAMNSGGSLEPEAAPSEPEAAPSEPEAAPSEPEAAPSKPQPPDAVLKAVVEAYYSRGVAAVDRAREGAQRGYTIASAIAAGLVAAGAFADISARPLLVQISGLLALASWLCVAVLFMWVLAIPTDTKRDPNWPDAAAFVEGVAAGVQEQLDVLFARLKWAFAGTILAIVITVAALSAATFLPEGAPEQKAEIAVTEKQDAALNELCSEPIGVVYGTVDPDDLDEDVVLVEMPAGACNVEPTQARIPSSGIVAVEKIEEFPGFPRP